VPVQVAGDHMPGSSAAHSGGDEGDGQGNPADGFERQVGRFRQRIWADVENTGGHGTHSASRWL
jgi:hypothetical protein